MNLDINQGCLVHMVPVWVPVLCGVEFPVGVTLNYNGWTFDDDGESPVP